MDSAHWSGAEGRLAGLTCIAVEAEKTTGCQTHPEDGLHVTAERGLIPGSAKGRQVSSLALHADTLRTNRQAPHH